MVSRFCAFISLILLPSLGSADTQPFNGTFIGSADGDILSYECGLIEGKRVTCSFVQVMMSKPQKSNQWSEEKLKIKNDFDSENPTEIKAMMCAIADQLEAGLKSVDDRAMDSSLRTYIEGNPEEAKVMVESSRKGCADPTFENLEPFFHQSFIRETLTCKPVVNKFEQTFVKVSENVWTVESSPTGNCGVVNTSRFEQDPKSGMFWNYFSSKVITNKAGEVFPGMACSDLDEATYEYLWNANPHKRDCVYLD